MAYLQLAENDYTMLAAANYDKYIFIPEGFRGAVKDSYVREDLFDTLPDMVYDQLMVELEQFNQVGLSGKADRKARREERKKLKATKKAGRGAAARREARQKRIETRAAAREKTGGFAGILGKVGEVAGNILGTNRAAIDVTAGGGDFSLDVDTEEETFFQKYKTPLIIGGVAIGGLVLYQIIKKK